VPGKSFGSDEPPLSLSALKAAAKLLGEPPLQAVERPAVWGRREGQDVLLRRRQILIPSEQWDRYQDHRDAPEAPINPYDSTMFKILDKLVAQDILDIEQRPLILPMVPEAPRKERAPLDLARVASYINLRARAEGFSGAAIVAKQQGTRSAESERLKQARRVILAELVDEWDVPNRTLRRVFGRSPSSLHELVVAGRAERQRRRDERDEELRGQEIPPDLGLPPDYLEWEQTQKGGTDG